MNRKEKLLYSQLLEKHRTRHFKHNVWIEALMKMIVYKAPHYVGAQHLKKVNPESLYIGANFVSSGRQDYMIQYRGRLYFHQTLCDYRREDIQLNKLSISQRERKERNVNVFKRWVVDDTAIIDACTKLDFQFWKVPNFIKEN